MSDVISRQAAIEALDEYFERIGNLKRRGLNKGEKAISLDTVGAIKSLPSAQPERIRGHWIESKGLNTLMKKFIEKGETWRVCDKCGAGFMIGYQYECDKLYHETFHNFCPKCGAEMEVTT